MPGKAKSFLLSAIETASLLGRRGGTGRISGVRKILVAETGGLGDLLRVFPVLDSLRLAFPGAAVTLLAAPLAAEVLVLYPDQESLSAIVPYEVKGRHRSAAAKLALAAGLRRQKFDLVYSPDRGEGMREEMLFSFLTGARHRLGFRKGRMGLLNTVAVEFREDRSILAQNLDILRAAGLPVPVERPRIRVPEGPQAEAERLLSGLVDAEPLVVIHPGSIWGEGIRQWPGTAYREFVEALLDDCCGSVAIVGSRAERPLGEDILSGLDARRTSNLAGATGVGTLAAVIERAAVFVGADSGPLHIASALGRPLVALFGPTSSEQVLSGCEGAEVLVSGRGCRPCYLHQYEFSPACGGAGPAPCMCDIRPGKVMAAVRRILSPGAQSGCA